MGPRCRRAGQLLGRGRPNLRGPGTAAPCPTELQPPRTRTGHRRIGGCGKLAGPGPRVTASEVQAGPEPREGPRPHSPSASTLTGRGAPLAPTNLAAERASCFSGERQLGLEVSPSLGVRQRHQGRPPSAKNRETGLGRGQGFGLSPTPRGPAAGATPELRAPSGAGRGSWAGGTRAERSPGAPREEGAPTPDSPRGVRALGRPGPSDHAASSSGTVNAGAQAPGGAGRGAPGARMPLALPWGRARAGTAASPARSREATAAAAATLWGARSLYFLYRSERGFQEEAGLGGQEVFFLSKAFRRQLAARSPPGAHGNPGSRARGAGPGGGGCRAGAPGAGAQPWGAASAAPASPGDPGEKLREKFPAWRRVAWEGRRSRSGPAGGEAKSFTQGTLPLYLLPEGASKSPLDSLRPEAGRLLHISDRWPCCLLLDASTDDELTTSQSSLFLHQARRLIHLSWVPHLDGSRGRKSVYITLVGPGGLSSKCLGTKNCLLGPDCPQNISQEWSAPHPTG